MYRRIFTALDDSPASAGLIPALTALVRDRVEPVEVHLVNAVDVDHDPADARALLDRAANQLSMEGIHAKTHTVTYAGGDVVGALASAVDRILPDLVLVGSRGHGDLFGLLFGSVCHGLLARAAGPVLVVRGEAAAKRLHRLRRQGRVMVAIGSTEETRMLANATAELAPMAEIMIVHAWEYAGTEAGVVVEDEGEAEALIRRAAKEFRLMGLSADANLLTGGGRVAHALQIAVEAMSADLVVTGSRRPGDLAGLVFGSVGHELMRHCRCPVLFAGARAEVVSEPLPRLAFAGR